MAQRQPKAALDPAIHRQILIVYEEAKVLGGRWNDAPIGTCESRVWSGWLSEHLGQCLNGIAQLTRAKRLDAKQLRVTYEDVLVLKATSKGKVGWDEGDPKAPAVAAWVSEIEGAIDRIIAGLRELIISFEGKGA